MNPTQEKFFEMICNGDKLSVLAGNPPMSDAERDALKAEISMLSDEQMGVFVEKLMNGMIEALRR